MDMVTTVINSLFGVILSVKGSTAQNIAISVGAQARSIYTKQKPNQEGDDYEMAADLCFSSSRSTVGAVVLHPKSGCSHFDEITPISTGSHAQGTTG